MNFAVPFRKSATDNWLLLLCVEHLVWWPIVAVTMRSIDNTAVNVLKEKINSLFGTPWIVVNDYAACFTAKLVQDIMAN